MKKSEKFWDWLSKSYDRKAKDKTYDQILLRGKKYLHSGAIVLDFACATGLYSLAFAGDVKEIHAFDTSAKMIAFAEDMAREAKTENVVFTKTDLFDEKYEENSFDTILALNILLYFKDPSEVLKRMYALLKPNGRIITSTACLRETRTVIGIVSRFILSLLKKVGILPYLRFLKISELQDFVSSNGFYIIEAGVLIEKPVVEYFIVAERSE